MRGDIALFILGIIIGMWIYKLFIINTLGKNPHTMCDYCKFFIKKNELFPRKKAQEK